MLITIVKYKFTSAFTETWVTCVNYNILQTHTVEFQSTSTISQQLVTVILRAGRALDHVVVLVVVQLLANQGDLLE